MMEFPQEQNQRNFKILKFCEKVQKFKFDEVLHITLNTWPQVFCGLQTLFEKILVLLITSKRRFNFVFKNTNKCLKVTSSKDFSYPSFAPSKSSSSWHMLPNKAKSVEFELENKQLSVISENKQLSVISVDIYYIFRFSLHVLSKMNST